MLPSKRTLINELSEKCGVPANSVTAILDTLAGIACREARNGFLLPGLGRLVVSTGPERLGRNPVTGKEIRIPPRQKIEFLPDSTAKDAILSQGVNALATTTPAEPAPHAVSLPEIQLAPNPDDLAKAGLHETKSHFNASPNSPRPQPSRPNPDFSPTAPPKPFSFFLPLPSHLPGLFPFTPFTLFAPFALPGLLSILHSQFPGS